MGKNSGSGRNPELVVNDAFVVLTRRAASEIDAAHQQGTINDRIAATTAVSNARHAVFRIHS